MATSPPSVFEYLSFAALAYAIKPTGTLDTGSNAARVPSGWQLATFTYSDAGLTAAAFANASRLQIVVAFRGSSSKFDWLQTDIEVAEGIRPVQFDQAVQFVRGVQQANAGYAVFVTGHSLGAIEAEYVAATLKIGGVTFAPTGITNLLHAGTPTMVPGLTNFVVDGDPVGEDTHGMITLDAQYNPYDFENPEEVLVRYHKGPGQHVGRDIHLPSTFYISDVLPPLWHGGMAWGQVVAGTAAWTFLMEHVLYTYGKSLVREGYIPSNPVPEPDYIYGDTSNALHDIRQMIAEAAQAIVTANGDMIRYGFYPVFP